MTEPWLTKRELAEHLRCSVRSIETTMAQGMPHAIIFRHAKFRVSEVEPWLEMHGYLKRGGDDPHPTPDPTEQANGANGQ